MSNAISLGNATNITKVKSGDRAAISLPSDLKDLFPATSNPEV
jgi:hypothetical protein